MTINSFDGILSKKALLVYIKLNMTQHTCIFYSVYIQYTVTLHTCLFSAHGTYKKYERAKTLRLF
jgi:hypothetical protein